MFSASALLAFACGRSEPGWGLGAEVGGSSAHGGAGTAGVSGGTGNVGGSVVTGGRGGTGNVGGSVVTGGSGGTGNVGGSVVTGGRGGTGNVGGSFVTGGRGGTGNVGGSFVTGGSGGTSGESCTGDADCRDADPCTTDRCRRGHCTNAPLDQDADGYGPAACPMGSDCNDRNPEVHPGQIERCDDGADNDCNGVIDCFDPACTAVPDCGCTASPEDCNNARDDDCDGITDCLDPDCDGSPLCGCLPSEAGACDNGLDDDCDSVADCDDPDCAAADTCLCRPSPESCSNGVDDDCDRLVDCSDPECALLSPCVCEPPGIAEVCDNGRDDDCDRKSDCADPDCVLSAACNGCTLEICDDGLDNDCDGVIDCSDLGCFLSPACPVLAEACNNGVDDDFDELVDCADPECAYNAFCAERQENCLTARLITGSGSWFGSTVGHTSSSQGTCGGAAGEAIFELPISRPSRVHLDTSGSDFDGVLYVRTGSCGVGRELGCDDDSAGSWDSLLEFDLLQPGTYFIFVDGLMVDPNLGPDEGNYVLHVEVTPDPGELCSNGADDDGDLLADCADPDCSAVALCAGCRGGLAAEPELGPAACTDGADNDCDGLTDCLDDDCHASSVFVTECCTGTDQNGNGIIDDFNCRCRDDGDCPGGQRCYGHTIRGCGIPCTSFVGDICPSEAPGSVCSAATQQCEF